MKIFDKDYPRGFSNTPKIIFCMLNMDVCMWWHLQNYCSEITNLLPIDVVVGGDDLNIYNKNFNTVYKASRRKQFRQINLIWSIDKVGREEILSELILSSTIPVSDRSYWLSVVCSVQCSFMTTNNEY